MASATLIAFLTIYSASAFLTHHDASSAIASKTKFLFLSYVSYAYPSLVGASPPIQEATKLKEKIKKGTKLLEELNLTLDSIKENLKKKLPIDKEDVERLMEIKNKFLNLKVDPTDLSKDLLENFRDRTLEAFGLILQGLNMGPIPELEKLRGGSFEDRHRGGEL
ncbi:hypothetical protein AVEN_91870-1 [Araneus ventricosus]|uniref:Uncharacterized protein n=1 Tax=Araneus ventricosus TaxID=182803 RepID=A0A4Y2GAB5_ARAVE|nr:hypothetical protein AVEN_91870-1 [Araneus ventricosus]